MLWSLPAKCRQGSFSLCSCSPHILHCMIYSLRLRFIQLSINPESAGKGEGNIWATSGCCPLLHPQLAVRTNAYDQKSCVSKEANNKVLLGKKHYHLVLKGALKSMLIASTGRVYKVNIPEKCLADGCSDSQEKAVALMTPSYLLIPLGWDKQRFLIYWGRERCPFQCFQCS